MIHLKNRRSGKRLCEVNRPKITDNVTQTGNLLGFFYKEAECLVCRKYFKEHERQLKKRILKHDSLIGNAISGRLGK